MDKLEQLSSFMDGELTQAPDSLLQAIPSETGLRNAWQRYHLIGDSLRGHRPGQISMELGQRIHAAIAAEPTILSPQPRRTVVVQRLLKPVAGLAIAASVAVVAVVGFQGGFHFADPAMQQVPAGAAVAVNTTPEPAMQYAVDRPPARTVAGETRRPAAPRQVRQQIAPQQRFNSYLINHSEYRANAGVQGFLPYVRIVAHESEE